MTAEFRSYDDADREELLDVWERSSRGAHSFLDDEFFVDERQQIADVYLPLADTTVAVIDGRVIGFVSMIGNEVGGLFVDPAHQGTGIGRRLLDGVREHRPRLELDVFERNASGRRFYRRYGFVEVGQHVREPTGEVELRLRLG